MSRVGKKPIVLPKGVKITVGEHVVVEGPKGKQTVPVPAGITFNQRDGKLELQRDGDDKAALHGLTRALAANAIQGVSTGFTRELQIFRHRLPLRREGPDRDVYARLFALDRVLSSGRDRHAGGKTGEQSDAADPHRK